MKYLLYLLALPAFAQFSGLVTNNDGSKLYFVSTLRQRNTTQPLHGKVFSLDDREMKPALILDQIKVNEQWSNFYNVLDPYLDSSGELTGVHALRTCYINFFQACKAAEGSTFGALEFLGNLTFSPNRRYALNAVWGGLSDYGFTLRDFTTNKILATATDYNSIAIVTDEGIAWRNTGSLIQRLAPGATAFETAFSAPGRFFAGISALPSTTRILTWDKSPLNQLLDIDITTKLETPIGNPIAENCRTIERAANGLLIAQCILNGNTRLLRLDSHQSEWRPIAESIKSHTLSTDGNVIWYLTADNAFHKVNLPAGTDETRLPPIGSVETFQFNTSPGSLFYINGNGINDATLYLRRGTASGTESTELIPVSRRDTQLVYLMPSTFAAPLSEYSFEFLSAAPSLFEIRQTISAQIEPIAPLFFTTLNTGFLPTPAQVAGNPVAANQDFSRLITPDNPARRGQVVHLWAVNLGPVNQDRLTTPGFGCFGGDSGNPQVLYAGPAPGIAGLYQVSLKLPDSFPLLNPNNPRFDFFCGFQTTFPRNAIISLPAIP